MSQLLYQTKAGDTVSFVANARGRCVGGALLTPARYFQSVQLVEIVTRGYIKCGMKYSLPQIQLLLIIIYILVRIFFTKSHMRIFEKAYIIILEKRILLQPNNIAFMFPTRFQAFIRSFKDARVYNKRIFREPPNPQIPAI